jgi:hypothetical protein
MARTGSERSGRGLVVLVLLCAAMAAAAVLWALSPPRPETPPPAQPQAGRQPGPAPSAASPLDQWERPALAVVFTGEQHGYLEPCGCTEKQPGGLARRAELFRRLREDRGWTVVGLDLGGALNEDRVLRKQERMKFEMTRQAQRAMGYGAAGLGREEVRVGADAFFELYSQEVAAAPDAPPFVCANVTLYGTRDTGTPIEYRLIEAGGVKLGVTSVLGAEYWKTLFPAGVTPEQVGYGYEPPADALARVLPKLQAAGAQVLVLLSHAPLKESRALTEQFPALHLVVTAGGPEDPRREPESVGTTMVLQVGHKGKHAGVVGIDFNGADPKLRAALIELEKDRFPAAPAIHELMRAYQARLLSERPDLTEQELTHPSGSEYAGVDTCIKCHEGAYDVWKNSRHSHAFESLSTGRPGEVDVIDRSFDAECLACHVTGWEPQRALRYRSGFVDFATTPSLAGQQCENCHGPASRHVALEEELLRGGEATAEHETLRRELHLELDVAKDKLCKQCHDIDNSPTFDTDAKSFDEFWWPEVAH